MNDLQIALPTVLPSPSNHKVGTPKVVNSFFHYPFQKSFDDIAQFDLILNIGKISTESAANLIVSLAKSKEIIACSINALETMDCMALEHKIHTELLRYNISTKEITLKVTRPGKVSIQGLA
jgi:hypothetical protein